MLGITAREARELVLNWERTADLMRDQAREADGKGNESDAYHALGIAQGLSIAIYSLKMLTEDYEGVNK